MKLIDIHNHILPNIDDGPKDIAVTMEMLDFAVKQGISEIVTTSHFLHPMMDKRNNLLCDIENKFSLVKDEIIKKKINIKLHAATEVYFMPEILNYINKKYVTFGKGKYILIEFPVNNIPEIHKKVFFDLKMKGITPIIAHPERYKQVQNNLSILIDWLEMGCIIQVDAGSVLNKLGNKTFIASQFIVENKLCQIIGSDAHNIKSRNFLLLDAYNACYKIVGDEAYNWVYYNPLKIIKGEKIDLNIDSDFINHSQNTSFIKKMFEKIKGKNV